MEQEVAKFSCGHLGALPGAPVGYGGGIPAAVPVREPGDRTLDVGL